MSSANKLRHSANYRSLRCNVKEAALWTSSITAEQIGEALRRTRKAGGWTQSDISAHTNLRVATISSLENGDAGTKLTTVLTIMAALGLEFRLVKRGRSLEIKDIF